MRYIKKFLDRLRTSLALKLIGENSVAVNIKFSGKPGESGLTVYGTAYVAGCHISDCDVAITLVERIKE